MSSTQRVSGRLSISQSSVDQQLHDDSKSIQNNQIEPHVTKILQNFWLTQLLFLISEIQTKTVLFCLEIQKNLWLREQVAYWKIVESFMLIRNINISQEKKKKVLWKFSFEFMQII